MSFPMYKKKSLVKLAPLLLMRGIDKTFFLVQPTSGGLVAEKIGAAGGQNGDPNRPRTGPPFDRNPTPQRALGGGADASLVPSRRTLDVTGPELEGTMRMTCPTPGPHWHVAPHSRRIAGV